MRNATAPATAAARIRRTGLLLSLLAGPTPARSRSAAPLRGAPFQRLARAAGAFPLIKGETQINGRANCDEEILFAHHGHQGAGQSERHGSADGPLLPRLQPDGHEQRDGKRGARMGERRRDVHIKEEWGTQPHRKTRAERVSADDPAGGCHGQPDCHEAVERRSVRDRGYIRVSRSRLRRCVRRLRACHGQSHRRRRRTAPTTWRNRWSRS